MEEEVYYTDLKNPYLLQWMFSKPTLKVPALSLLNSFIFPDSENAFVELENNWSSHQSCFYIKGTFFNCLVLTARDSNGKTHYIEWHVLHLHPGIVNTRFEVRQDVLSFFLKERKARNELMPMHFVGIFTFGLQGIDHFLAQIPYPLPDYSEQLQLTLVDIDKFSHTLQQNNDLTEIWTWMFKHGMQKNSLDSFDAETKRALQPLLWENLSPDARQEYNRYFIDMERKQKYIDEFYRANFDPRMEKYMEYPAKKATFSLLHFEHSLGLYPRQSVSIKQIDPVQQDISNMAFGLFRQWISKMEKEFPEYDLTIKNERLLTRQTRQALKEAVKDFYESEKFIKDLLHPADYQAEFRLKFEVILARIWYYEYIVKSGNTYKIYTALKAMLHYFAEEKSRSSIVNNLYQKLLADSLNLLEPDSKIEVWVEQQNRHEGRKHVRTKENDPVKDALLKLYLDYDHMQAKYSTNVFVESEKFLSNEHIQTILQRNYKLYQPYSQSHIRFPIPSD